MLRLIVTRTLDGQADVLKEYNLGLDVFQRPPDYDPKVDPIVRVQARRLRTKLDEYYAAEGAHNPVVITIPKGAYVPAFDRREPAATPKRRPKLVWLAAAVVLLLAAVLAWAKLKTGGFADDLQKSVAVLPLEMFAAGGSRSYVADEVTEVLTTGLSKSKDLHVVSRTTASQYRETRLSLPEIARRLRVRWIVEGGVGVEGDHSYVKLRLEDATTDRKVWADVFDFGPSQLVPVSSRAAAVIAGVVGDQIRVREPASKR